MLFGKYIGKYYLQYWYFYLLGILALITVDIAQLYEPEYLGQIVDHLSGGSGVDIHLVTSICGKIMLIACIMFVGRMAWRYTLFNASQRIEAGLRNQMFLKSERLSQRYYHETKVGSIMSWFTTDLETIEEYCCFGTVRMVDSLFMGILVICKMIQMDWVLAAFAFVPMILIVVWGALVEKYMVVKWDERQKQYDRLYDFVQENFTGIRVIKAFVKETGELHAFAKVARKNKDTNISFVKISVLFDVIIQLIIAAIMAMILGFGGWFAYLKAIGSPLSLAGHIIQLTPGQLVTFIGYFDMLIWPLIALGSLVTMYSRAKTSLNRISSFLDQPEEIHSPENALPLENVKGEVEFRNLTFSYPHTQKPPVLKNISFHIAPGERIGIVGRIGSGKSTLVTLLLRLYNLEKDSVFIDGKDIMNVDISSLRRCIAFVPQDNFLFSDTVGNNIAFSNKNSSAEAIRAAAVFADVDENIQSFENGYDTVTGERGVTLSGGQKQRVSLARAYLKDAPILILDDSVSAVDLRTEEKILANIQKKRAGKTTIVISSRVSTVSHFDKILVLKDGQAEAFDTPARLMQISPTYQKMVYLQELEKEVEGGND